jgi:D-3-phosphoglycerate dehydrogenase
MIRELSHRSDARFGPRAIREALTLFSQYYETRSDVGYVVLDADASAADSQRVLGEIRSLEGTIRARLLYEHRF